jgi:hypothetical protein
VRFVWTEVRLHWRSATCFLGLWVILAAVTVTTWVYQDGYASGMHERLVPLHILLPLIAGGFAGTWQGTAGLGIRVGALVYLANSAFLLVWGRILAFTGKAAPGVAGPSGVLPFLVLGTLIGAVLGAAGAVVGRFAAGLVRRPPRTVGPGA